MSLNQQRKLALPPDFIKRIEAYHQHIQVGSQQSETAKSDYWRHHSSRAKIRFFSDSVEISGESGFYIPPHASSLKYRFRDRVQGIYKRTVLTTDRILRLSAPHSLGSFLTYPMAYDFVMKKDKAVDYDANPYSFDPLLLKPLFKTSSDLSQRWFLKDRYLASANIIIAAYYHAVFSHFHKEGAGHYLEIGAGSGNLASFFKNYGNYKIVIVDLPETILYSSCFLKSVFPDASILLPNEVKGPLKKEDIDAYDFSFLLPSQTHLLPERIFDVSVNTASMQEMTWAQIQEYFHLVQRTSKMGAIWGHINRVEKFPSKTEKPFRAFEFPYDRRNEVLLDQVDRFMRLVSPDDMVIHVEKVNP